jgi:Domain of unknown function (DUF222)
MAWAVCAYEACLTSKGRPSSPRAIQPLSGPVSGDDGPDRRTVEMRRADALVDVCRLAVSSGQTPVDGGQPAQVIVTIDSDALARDVAVGQLDVGTALSPDATRRLACDAGILPVILDGAGVPIDVGRSRRPFTGSARTAVLIRDGGCAFPAASGRLAGVISTTSCSGPPVVLPTGIMASPCARTTTTSSITGAPGGRSGWATTTGLISFRQRTWTRSDDPDAIRTTRGDSRPKARAEYER